MIYLKKRSSFKTYKQIYPISYDMTLESMSDDTSSLVVPAGTMDGEDTGAWLICEGRLYLVAKVTPGDDNTKVECRPPQTIFDRDLFYGSDGTTIGGFIEDTIASEFMSPAQADLMYAYNYIVLSNSDSTPFVMPEFSKDGPTEGSNTDAVWNLFDYLSMVRKTYGVFVEFSISANNYLLIEIGTRTQITYNVPFGDGVSFLRSQSYGSEDTVAKATVIYTETITDENEQTEEITSKITYYLGADGTISTTEPENRIAGSWVILQASGSADPAEVAAAALAGSTGDHKIEFASKREFHLGDACRFWIDGRSINGRISKVSRNDTEDIWHYTSGDLTVTLTDKLKKKG